MNLDVVTMRLCALVSKVGSEHFKSQVAHDCFCIDALVNGGRVTVDKQVVEFIESAVAEKLAKSSGASID